MARRLASTLLLFSLAAAALALQAVRCARAEVVADLPVGLLAAAQAEGELAVMALPRDWCGYGAIIDGFKARFGLKVTEIEPDAGSGDELERIRRGGSGGQPQPDVIDIGLAFGPAAKAAGLVVPYKVSVWSRLPDIAKDADGAWYGDYYGVLTFEVNADKVADLPGDWNDLLAPSLRGSVALAGDPLSSNQAIQSVYAAGLAEADNDPDRAAEAGLQFFARLNQAGNFAPVVGRRGSVEAGSTPVLIRWDFAALADRDFLAGKTRIAVVVPRSGVVAGVYVQAISASAPHPNAARLWMEWLFSDEGQIGFLRGACHPIRFGELLRAGKIPAELLARLPPADAYQRAIFPSVGDQAAAREIILKQWGAIVGAEVR